jgi:hypothetical protein
VVACLCAGPQAAAAAGGRGGPGHTTIVRLLLGVYIGRMPSTRISSWNGTYFLSSSPALDPTSNIFNCFVSHTQQIRLPASSKARAHPPSPWRPRTQCPPTSTSSSAPRGPRAATPAHPARPEQLPCPPRTCSLSRAPSRPRSGPWTATAATCPPLAPRSRVIARVTHSHLRGT